MWSVGRDFSGALHSFPDGAVVLVAPSKQTLYLPHPLGKLFDRLLHSDAPLSEVDLAAELPDCANGDEPYAALDVTDLLQELAERGLAESIDNSPPEVP